MGCWFAHKQDGPHNVGTHQAAGVQGGQVDDRQGTHYDEGDPGGQGTHHAGGAPGGQARRSTASR